LVQQNLFVYSKEQLGAFLIGLTILSTFSPIKIYPVFFVLTSLALLMLHPRVRLMGWAVWLGIYVGYALLMALIFDTTLTTSHLPLESDQLANLAKLVVNNLFLIVVINWASYTDREYVHIDFIFHLSFALTLLQLLVYRYKAGLTQLFVDSSSMGSEMYDPKYLFWGIADKNIFGARMCLFGFLYILNFFLRERRIPFWRTVVVLACALLSLSRTPLVALFIGLGYLLYRRFGLWKRILLIASALAVTPFALAKLLRIDTLLEQGDGMGVRIIYWTTFFQHFTGLSIFGTGFMAGGRFLTKYSPVYLGEPHLHNIFLNNYLDFGIVGFVSYIAFLVALYRFCKRDEVWFKWYWTAAFLPILAIMPTLFTGYEADTSIYLSCIYIIGHASASLKSERRNRRAELEQLINC
jgi:hypothetical protein